jgi:hypothetical protein
MRWKASLGGLPYCRHLVVFLISLSCQPCLPCPAQLKRVPRPRGQCMSISFYASVHTRAYAHFRCCTHKISSAGYPGSRGNVRGRRRGRPRGRSRIDFCLRGRVTGRLRESLVVEVGRTLHHLAIIFTFAPLLPPSLQISVALRMRIGPVLRERLRIKVCRSCFVVRRRPLDPLRGCPPFRPW